MTAPTTAPTTPDAILARHRRDQRLLRALGTAAALVAVGLIVTCLYLLFGVGVTHPAFIFMNILGVTTGMLRLLVSTVADQPRALRDLLSPDPAVRTAACQAIDRHRAELVTPALALARPRDKARLAAASCAELADWLATCTNWWRVGRTVLALWTLAFATLLAVLLTIDPQIRAG